MSNPVIGLLMFTKESNNYCDNIIILFRVLSKHLISLTKLDCVTGHTQCVKKNASMSGMQISAYLQGDELGP